MLLMHLIAAVLIAVAALRGFGLYAARDLQICSQQRKCVRFAEEPKKKKACSEEHMKVLADVQKSLREFFGEGMELSEQELEFREYCQQLEDCQNRSCSRVEVEQNSFWTMQKAPAPGYISYIVFCMKLRCFIHIYTKTY